MNFFKSLVRRSFYAGQRQPDMRCHLGLKSGRVECDGGGGPYYAALPVTVTVVVIAAVATLLCCSNVAVFLVFAVTVFVTIRSTRSVFPSQVPRTLVATTGISSCFTT